MESKQQKEAPQEVPQDILEKLQKLEQKYEVMGQDMRSYLDGLIHADYLTYWDYVHLDTLLSLQSPKTTFPDEFIFIGYHQITELYFRLTLHEIYQVADAKELTAEKFLLHLRRITNYFSNLIESFSIMIDGMEQEQFLQFRMSLLPASGFQSAQYRMIELTSTHVHNLLAFNQRDLLTDVTDPDILLANLYWKRGATELATGKKTLTLKQFEEKYAEEFHDLVVRFNNTNLLACYESLPASEKTDELKKQLRILDHYANVDWPLMHYKSAVRYLQRDPADIAATGGTNWQKYLPPRFQGVIFFPDLWSAEERENWGKKNLLGPDAGNRSSAF